MTRSLDPKPAENSDDGNDTRLMELAARYFDLWQENWTAWLGPPQEEEEPESS
jgi:hypothetical protein